MRMNLHEILSKRVRFTSMTNSVKGEHWVERSWFLYLLLYLNAARLADVADTDTVIIARTDAEECQTLIVGYR